MYANARRMVPLIMTICLHANQMSLQLLLLAEYVNYANCQTNDYIILHHYTLAVYMTSDLKHVVHSSYTSMKILLHKDTEVHVDLYIVQKLLYGY